MEYLYALADFYLKREQFQKANNMAQQMVMKHPNEPIGQELLGIIMRKLPKANQ
jgi:predicted Zn-dependent protease